MEGNSISSTMIGSTPPFLAQDVYQVSFQKIYRIAQFGESQMAKILNAQNIL
jgi:hypothetical protein